MVVYGHSIAGWFLKVFYSSKKKGYLSFFILHTPLLRDVTVKTCFSSSEKDEILYVSKLLKWINMDNSY